MPDPMLDRSGLHRAARWIGGALFIAVSWLYLVSGLVAPAWAVGMLWVAWVVQVAALMTIWSTRPWHVLAAPGVAFLLWASVVLAGDVLLGWSA